MLKFILPFILSPIAIASTGFQTTRPLSSNASFSTFTVSNDCSRHVTVAVNWQLPNNATGFWFTNWFTFEPYATHQLVNTESRFVYLYAESTDQRSKIVWNGKCSEDAYLPDAVYDENNKLYGCTFPIDLGAGHTNVTYHLTCL